MHESSLITIIVIGLIILTIVSPLGIWNRLIRINNEQKEHNKAIEKKINTLINILKYIAENSVYEEVEGSEGETKEDAS